MKWFLQRMLQEIIKKNEMIFAKNVARNYKKKMLGTSDACSMSHLSHRPSEPAYYIVNWPIPNHTAWMQKFFFLIWPLYTLVHFRGKYGEATVNVPFAKISQVDFRPANTGTSSYTVATVTLNSGQQLDLSLENQSNVYAETPFAELEISVADLRQLDFSEWTLFE